MSKDSCPRPVSPSVGFGVDFLFYFFLLLQSESKMCVTAAADALSDTTAETNESVRAAKADTDSQTSFNTDGDKGQPSTPQLLPERCTEALSPPKTPSSVSLAESTQSASHSEFPTGVCLALGNAAAPQVSHWFAVYTSIDIVVIQRFRS